MICHRFVSLFVSARTVFLLLGFWAKENVIFSLRTQVSIENASPMLLPFKGHGDYLSLTRRDTSIPHTSHESRVRSIKSDTQTDMLLGEPKSAICVQRFNDSLNSAIHTTYRSWLRSSSIREPRDPPSKVVSHFPFSLMLIMHDTFSVFNVQSDMINTMAGLAEGTYPPFNDTRLCRPLKSCWTVHTGWLMLFNLGFFISVMILPQVHLRKPCYDFYFL